ncbi:hypothetical protein LX36DRAFT_391793 [Colletotrichum falcatum]|nr:hypothetical protein LX36DRAFT_391793 [Colletotrichum falcatum]
MVRKSNKKPTRVLLIKLVVHAFPETVSMATSVSEQQRRQRWGLKHKQTLNGRDVLRSSASPALPSVVIESPLLAETPAAPPKKIIMVCYLELYLPRSLVGSSPIMCPVRTEAAPRVNVEVATLAVRECSFDAGAHRAPGAHWKPD